MDHGSVWIYCFMQGIESYCNNTFDSFFFFLINKLGHSIIPKISYPLFRLTALSLSACRTFLDTFLRHTCIPWSSPRCLLQHINFGLYRTQLLWYPVNGTYINTELVLKLEH